MFNNENYVGFSFCFRIKIFGPFPFVSHFKQNMKMFICQQRHVAYDNNALKRGRSWFLKCYEMAGQR